MCKQCADVGIELMKEKKKVESQKKHQFKLNDMLKKERKKVEQMQKEMNELKMENRKFIAVR